jgi:hypothetical protein
MFKRTVPGCLVDVICLAVLIANLIKGPGDTPAGLTIYDALLIGSGAWLGVALVQARLRQIIRRNHPGQYRKPGQP